MPMKCFSELLDYHLLRSSKISVWYFFPTEKQFYFNPEQCWIVYCSTCYQILPSSVAVKCTLWLSNKITNAFLLLLTYQWWERNHCFLNCHFWIFWKNTFKCPVFNNFFGVLRNLHDLKAGEKGNDKDEKGTHVQVLSLFLHLIIISTLLNPVFTWGGEKEEFP